MPHDRDAPTSRKAVDLPDEAPLVSVVIPIHDEEGILERSVADFVSGLRDLVGDRGFELVLAENGSADATMEIAGRLAERYPEVRVISYPEPNYGAALREGILASRGTYVLCDEIDLCDLDFHARALKLLESGAADMIVGSKAMPGARDDRPLLRRAATRVINGLLRLLLGFHGTDTHGLKAFRRDRLVPVVRACVVDKDLFASELVVRSELSDVRILEVPIQVREKRTPSVNLFKRVPSVLWNLGRLVYVLKLKR